MEKPQARQATKSQSLRQGSMQQKRRDMALERQREARRDLTEMARCIALSTVSNAPDASALAGELYAADAKAQAADAERPTPESGAGDDASMEASVASSPSREDSATQRQRGGRLSPGHTAGSAASFRNQLMLPEWLNDIPTDLATSWWRRAGAPSAGCETDGSSTASPLPSPAAPGAAAAALPLSTQPLRPPPPCPLQTHSLRAKYHPRSDLRGTSSGSDHTILDCVFHEADQTYYVLDVMCWRGYSLYDCTTEFRLFWAQSKLAESGAAAAPGHLHRFRFAQLPVYPATPEGIAAAYSPQAPPPFVRDGLHFLTKEANYEPGHTPLALAWKDAACSPYFIDTDAEGVVPEHQRIVLQLLADGVSVGTADEPPVPFGALSQDVLAQIGAKAREGYLVKFIVGPGGILMADGRPAAADLAIEGAAARRGDADTLNKILFQYNARRSPITIEELVAASSAVSVGERFGGQSGGVQQVPQPPAAAGGGVDVAMQ